MVQMRAKSTWHTYWTHDPLLLTGPWRWHLAAETCRSWHLIWSAKEYKTCTVGQYRVPSRYQSQLFTWTENFLRLQSLEVIIVIKENPANELSFQTLQSSTAFSTMLLVLRGSTGLNVDLSPYGHNEHLLILHESATETFVKLRCLAKRHKGAKIPFQFRIQVCSIDRRTTNPSLHCSVQKGQRCPGSEVLFDRCCVAEGRGWGGGGGC